MSKNTPETPATKPVFHKVGQNLYRLESSGKYYALLKRGGKQIRKSLKTDDKALAMRRLGELREKVTRLNQTKGAGKLTFQELGKRWLANQIGLKPASISRLDICLKGLAPVFGDVPVRNITSRHCEDWIARRGKEISASSYKHERRVLIALLDYAMRDGLILGNPAEDVVPTRKIARPKTIIPTREQFRVLVETLRLRNDSRAQPAADLLELLAYSGMRLNEATSMTWEDADWERGTFVVTGGERGTKNLEARVVPLFPALRELLERLRGDRQPEATERIIPIRDAKTAIIKACKDAKLPRFLHHSMRHYFCSNAIEAGIDFKVIAGWLGHKDGGYLVARTYGHLRDTHSFEMAKRMTFTAAPTPGNVLPIAAASAVSNN